MTILTAAANGTARRKLPAVALAGFFLAFPAERINAPSHASSKHQDRTTQRRGRKTGEQKHNKSAHGQGETDELLRVQAFAFAQAPENHRGLDRAKEKQCARSGGETVIGKRKGRGIGEERQRGRPVARLLPCPIAHLHDEPKRGRASGDADESKTGRVDAGLLQRQPTEQGVARERDHRRQRQDEKSCGIHGVDPAR